MAPGELPGMMSGGSLTYGRDCRICPAPVPAYVKETRTRHPFDSRSHGTDAGDCTFAIPVLPFAAIKRHHTAPKALCGGTTQQARTGSHAGAEFTPDATASRRQPAGWRSALQNRRTRPPAWPHARQLPTKASRQLRQSRNSQSPAAARHDPAI